MFRCLVPLLLLAVACWAELPEGWQVCKLGSTGYEDCLKNAINIALTSLKNGSKELGVSPIDPLRIETLKVDQGTGPVNLKMEFMNMDIYGLSKCQINSIKNDWKTMEASVFCKNNSMSCHYKLSGQVLTLPATGEGSCHIQIGELTAELSGKLKEIEKGGQKYFDLSSYKMDVHHKDVKLNFENLFNGNKELSDSMNIFINENSDLIMKEVEPTLSKAFSQVYFQVASHIFSKIPSADLNVK